MAHFVWWFQGYRGVEAIYSTLAGILAAKGMYRYSALPTLLDVYSLTQDWRHGKTVTRQGLMKIALWLIGFVLAYMRYI